MNDYEDIFGSPALSVRPQGEAGQRDRVLTLIRDELGSLVDGGFDTIVFPDSPATAEDGSEAVRNPNERRIALDGAWRVTCEIRGSAKSDRPLCTELVVHPAIPPMIYRLSKIDRPGEEAAPGPRSVVVATIGHAVTVNETESLQLIQDKGELKQILHALKVGVRMKSTDEPSDRSS